MKYVALLRGINVGGNNKIAMSELKASFESAGFHNVRTYINSGNIIFETDQTDKHKIIESIESFIVADFGLSIPAIIRSKDEIKEILDTTETSWTNDQTVKTDVLFLWETVDESSALEQLVIKEVDTVRQAPGALVWQVLRKNQTKSGLAKIVDTPLYKQVTIRNINTVRKLYALMDEE